MIYDRNLLKPLNSVHNRKLFVCLIEFKKLNLMRVAKNYVFCTY